MKRILLFAALVFACNGEKPQPQPPGHAVITPEISIVADTLQVALNSEFWLEHYIEAGKDVYAVAARLRYDSTYVQIVKDSTGRAVSQNGGFLGSNSNLTVTLHDTAKAIVFAYSKLGTQPGQNGQGALWRVAMRAVKAGSTALAFDTAKSAVLSPRIVNGVQERLPAEFVNGVLTIDSVSPAVVRLRVVEK